MTEDFGTIVLEMNDDGSEQLKRGVKQIERKWERDKWWKSIINLCKYLTDKLQRQLACKMNGSKLNFILTKTTKKKQFLSNT